MNHSLQKGPPPIIVFWIIWFALINGLCIMQFVIGGGFPEGENQGSPPTTIIGITALMTVASVGIRFLVIPKIKELTHLLPVMLVGLAMAEFVGIISIFMLGNKFPETSKTLFISSLFCMVMYAPVYANKLASEKR